MHPCPPSLRPLSVTGEPTAFEDVYEMAVDVPIEPDVDMRKLVADHEEIIKRVEQVNQEVCVECAGFLVNG
jgi:hypothetical protein